MHESIPPEKKVLKWRHQPLEQEQKQAQPRQRLDFQAAKAVWLGREATRERGSGGEWRSSLMAFR